MPQLTLLCQLLCSLSVRSQEMSSLSGQKNHGLWVDEGLSCVEPGKKFLNVKHKSGEKSCTLWCSQIVLLDRMCVFIITALTVSSVFLPCKYSRWDPTNQAFCEVHS